MRASHVMGTVQIKSGQDRSGHDRLGQVRSCRAMVTKKQRINAKINH